MKNLYWYLIIGAVVLGVGAYLFITNGKKSTASSGTGTGTTTGGTTTGGTGTGTGTGSGSGTTTGGGTGTVPGTGSTVIVPPVPAIIPTGTRMSPIPPTGGASRIAPIVGASTINQGDTTTLTDATIGGGWSSSDTSIAIVDMVTGLVTGIAPGTAVIQYSVSSTGTVYSASFPITVVAVPGIVVTPPSSTPSGTAGTPSSGIGTSGPVMVTPMPAGGGPIITPTVIPASPGTGIFSGSVAAGRVLTAGSSVGAGSVGVISAGATRV